MTISIKLGDAVNAYLIYIIFDKKLVMKNLLFLLFTFNCAFTFGQTWETRGFKLVKTGASITVKWTNDTGGVTTQKAICDAGSVSNTYVTSLAAMDYKCTCTNGDYFELRLFTPEQGDPFATITYYNELNSQYKLNGKDFYLRAELKKND